MKKFGWILLILILGEVWIFNRQTKTEAWVSRGSQASVGVTPQILAFRNNYHDFVDSRGVATLPLGSRSHAEIVLCEESTGMITYRSDRYGFRNPDSAWNAEVEIAMIGDSFTQGACVKDGEDMAAHLRGSLGNVLNLGSLGNGPLANLAVISEYLKKNPPKKLLWFHVANDFLIDGPMEDKTSLLKAYEDPTFTQNLIERQTELDRIINDFLVREKDKEGNPLVEWLQLTNTQNALSRLMMDKLRLDSSRQGGAMDYASVERVKYSEFGKVLELAKSHLPNTEIILVIVPDAGMFSEGFQKAATTHVSRLRGQANALGIQTIDLRSAFASVAKPLSFYALTEEAAYGHFSPEGYRLVSEYLIKTLDSSRDNVSP